MRQEALLTCYRLSPNQIQKLLNQYLVADYEQPINGEIMKAVASRVTEKSDVLLLQAVDMEDSGPYEIAEPRAITALETYTPSCKTYPADTGWTERDLLTCDCSARAPNSPIKEIGRNRFGTGHCAAGEA
jgi:myosin-5